MKSSLLAELKGYDICESVLKAIEKVPRENFVLQEDVEHAYSNYPLPIYEEQTISQPLTVALMSQWLDVKPGNSILEIGSGSGYQAAVLSELAGPEGKVTTCEVRKKLFEFAKNNLGNYRNVEVIHANASRGYGGMYDRVIMTASARKFPDALFGHLKTGGMMIVPVGSYMVLAKKTKNGVVKEMKGYFAFVPLVES